MRRRPRANVVPLGIPEGARVLAMSDIHTQRGLFEECLRRADFREERDYLVLNGDFVEKGQESLKFLRYLMDFQKGRQVLFVRGNCDHLVPECAQGWARPEHLWHYMEFRPESVFWQMGEEAGFRPRGPEDVPELGRIIRDKFEKELRFILEMPTIRADEHAVFVHGGVPRDRDMEQLDARDCMKNDFFLQQESRLERWVLVGHTPVGLYCPQIFCANPVVDREKHIIAMDGGCAIKPDGQLNCLIFPSWGRPEMDFVSADGLAEVTAQAAQPPSENSRTVRWGNHQVTVLEERGDAALCRQNTTGLELVIPQEFLHERDGAVYTQDVSDYHLPVAPGDRLKVVSRTSYGLLAKQNGVTGWYFGPWA